MREVEYKRMFNGPNRYEHEEFIVRDTFPETMSDVDAIEKLNERIENMYSELQRQRANERALQQQRANEREKERNLREAKKKERIDALRVKISDFNQEILIIQNADDQEES